MKKRLVALSLVLVLVVSVFAVGCSQSGNNTSSQGDKEKEPETVHLTIGSASVGGAYYAIAMQLAKLWNDNVPGAKAVAQATAGSPQNIELMGSGELQLSVVRGQECYEAYNGLGLYEGRKNESLRALAPLYYSGLQVVALKDRGIDSIADFRGKRIAVGPIGSGGDVDSRQALELYGMTYDDIKPEFVDAAQAVEMMKDGQIDGAFLGLTVGASSIAELMLTGKVNMLSFEEDKLQEFLDANPLYSRFVIRAGTYPNQDYDAISHAGLPTIVGTTEKMDDEVAYNLTKAMAENVDFMRESHAAMAYWEPELAEMDLLIPYHPGAEKYWKEQGIR
jgi:TRAP transporter TAXI family solute receptor